jgi:CHASE3 domain sensor protein
MSTDPGTPPPQDNRTFQRVLIFFVLILAVMVAIVVATLSNLNRSIATSDWVNHTHALITELDALQPSLAAAEGDLSRYLLTADPRDHSAYQEKFADLGERVAVITALIANSPGEQQQFTPIASLLARRAELASRIANLKKAGDSAALQQLLGDETIRSEQRDLQRRVEKMRETQTNLLTERDRASFQQAQTTRWTALGGVVFEFLLLCGAAWLIRDDLAMRRQAARLLEQTNEQLEAKVRQRTAELTASNEKLVTQNLEDRWAKQALEHQNRYNLLIIDSISDAVFVVTKLMNVSRMNPAAVHLTGCEPATLIDKPIAAFLRLEATAGSATPGFDPLVRTLIEGHELRQQAALLTNKSGATIPCRLNVFPLRDRDKVVGGVVVLQALSSS